MAKLQIALGFTTEQTAALPEPLKKIQELEHENARLLKEIDELHIMLSSSLTGGTSNNQSSRNSLKLCNTSADAAKYEDIPRLGTKMRELEDRVQRNMLENIESVSFQESLKARTNARIRIFCSLNRAGNALCGWHDSRRERRVYPPRMAPSGYLNCGCTYEEALFEESLARHNVGSYALRDTVRMDPALRNPLLRLLQQRYGYKDGDFERDPETGDWLPGEGPALWEAQIQGSTPSARRTGRQENNSQPVGFTVASGMNRDAQASAHRRRESAVDTARR